MKKMKRDFFEISMRSNKRYSGQKSISVTVNELCREISPGANFSTSYKGKNYMYAPYIQRKSYICCLILIHSLSCKYGHLEDEIIPIPNNL